MQNQTILAFDFGTKSIGVAIGQSITGTAAPLSALKANDGIPNWEAIEKLIEQWQPNGLLVGLPLNMDGTEQEITQRAKKFANRLHGRYGLNVVTHDERLSTVDAKARLFDLGGFKKLSKDKVDSVSACLIYESWLENTF
ncbi:MULTISPECIES: Holliday junction resolvase RuvX [Alteromonadaceae]|jgi:putative Holliday junction resolvase|uniref:Putative pre-16S rRNA nuclease n=1 Tax=Brumicola blandensis TaxID=3075611 RepID=A0AAW8R3D4_9ALTE|nr:MULTISPECIES: Holliday junction resolvase RuvX [unclassified Alteromonas]MDT0583219.1 Holliday junction resolvase RuvX [Alteromonas sp. W409]MDT0627525.1 Holliday junction resolvase RuvX [Alteromonas sp. W364]